MALTSAQQTQYNQLVSAGASASAAMQAALLVPSGTVAPAPSSSTSPTYSGAAGAGTGSIIPIAPATSYSAPSTTYTQPASTPTLYAPAPNPTPQPVVSPTTTNTQTTATPSATTLPTTIPQTAGQAQTATPLTMPASGSVVDLLNMAGQDSSFASRQQLAQQFGIQGYTGTAAQNTDLSKKYLTAFNANKGTTAPQSGAQASSALDTYFQDNAPGETGLDPIKSFMDSFAGMNPIEANLFQQLSTLASTQTNHQSLTDFYKQEVSAQGIPELNMELADINKVMDGTEDDIRDEVASVGGFATESQVQALTGARNKTLLKKANYLSNVLNAKNDYVDRIVSLTQADRKQVSEDLDRKLGITKTLFDMSQQMTNNAKENYKMIVDSVGWEGLAKSLQGNPAQMSKVSKLFGLAPGELQALAAYKKPLTAMEQLQLENQQLQNKKLRQDLNTGPAISTQLQNFGTSDNPHYKLINSKTGVTITDYGSTLPTPDKTMQLAGAHQTITDTDSLIKNPSLNAAVGPNIFARFGPISGFTGGTSNFVAGVEQLRGQLTLQNLQNAKTNGATFGALSDSELSLLSSSASKLGSWAIKDKAGNVTGYQASEADFKRELDRINNFSKLDFILKGGSPASVGVTQTPDGNLWVKNSDGTLTNLK